MRYITAVAATLLSASGLFAQSIEESLTVEGRYTPEVIAADRLPVGPAAVAIAPPATELDNDLSGVAVNFPPDALSMPATGWRTSKAFDSSRGYIDLMLGSWLNSSLSAGVAAIKSDDTSLTFRLQHNSTSLWRAWTLDHDTQWGLDADRRFRYDETIGAGFRHSFASAGTLSADMQYHFGSFNYYGSHYGTEAASADASSVKAPTQTLNDFLFRARWAGKTGSPLSYHVDAAVRYFGYAHSYSQPDFLTVMQLEKGNGAHETAVDLLGAVGYTFSGSSSLAAEIDYSGVLNSVGNDVNRFRLMPRYEYTRSGISLRIGAEIAVVDAASTRFRIAPDVRFSARSGIAAFSARIGGGTALRTLAWRHQLDYYADPLAVCSAATYSPLDASLAFQLNPGGRWTFGLEGRWRTALDEAFGGLYQAYLNWQTGDFYPLSGRLHGFTVGVNAGYRFSRYFGLDGRFNWQPQHGNSGFLDGFDRPAITAALSASSNPIDHLSIRLDYQLRAKRQLLRGNISRLNFSAHYRITDRLTLQAEINNLLNRHEMLLPDLPSEGITALGGLQLTF